MDLPISTQNTLLNNDIEFDIITNQTLNSYDLSQF